MSQALFEKNFADVIDSDPDKRNEFLFWQEALHRLEKGGNWSLFLERIDGPIVTHPAARLAQTRTGQTLLHLAVLFGKEEIVRELGKDVHLRQKKNRYGLGPIELARLLNKKELALILEPLPPPHPFPEPLLGQIEYLAHPIFEKEEDFYHILTKTRKAKLEDAIPPEKIWMGVYFDKEIHKGLHPPISIRHIDDEVGYGVFAAKKIPPCAYVGEYTGIIQERKKRHLNEKVYCVRYTVWEMGRKKFVIDAEKRGNFTRFINHSAKPNLCLQSIFWRGLPRMIFVALKEIQEGTQLTFDYGSFFWKECCQTPKIIE